MYLFSYKNDRDQNIGELVFESLLNTNVDSIIDLNLGLNYSWFWRPYKKKERSGNIDLLAMLISKQTSLQKFDLRDNKFSSNATLTLLTQIADVITKIELTNLNLDKAVNFYADESVEKLAVILQSA